MLDVRPGGEHHFHRVPGEDLQLSQARLIVGIGAGDRQHAVIDSDRQQRVSACVGTIDQGERPDLARGVIQIDGVGRRPAARDERLDGGTDGCRILNHSNIIGRTPVSGNGNRPTSWSLLSRPGRVLTWDKAAMALRMPDRLSFPFLQGSDLPVLIGEFGCARWPLAISSSSAT